MSEGAHAQPRKTAIVTGAGRGIGRAIALALAELGWTVVINDLGDDSPAQETLELVRQRGADGLVVLADIAAGPDRDRLVAETLAAYGRIDLLVNNAGIAPPQRMDLLETTPASLQEVLAVNLVGPFFLTQLAARHMIALLHAGQIESAQIINIGSISAYTASPNRAEYCISKAGLSMATLLFADRLAAENINVYEIRPGIIETPMTAPVKDKYDALIAGGVTPLRRWGRPEDVSKAVQAIALGLLPFSTGQVIDVDGGFHIHRL